MPLANALVPAVLAAARRGFGPVLTLGWGPCSISSPSLVARVGNCDVATRASSVPAVASCLWAIASSPLADMSICLARHGDPSTLPATPRPGEPFARRFSPGAALLAAAREPPSDAVDGCPCDAFDASTVAERADEASFCTALRGDALLRGVALPRGVAWLSMDLRRGMAITPRAAPSVGAASAAVATIAPSVLVPPQLCKPSAAAARADALPVTDAACAAPSAAELAAGGASFAAWGAIRPDGDPRILVPAASSSNGPSSSSNRPSSVARFLWQCPTEASSDALEPMPSSPLDAADAVRLAPTRPACSTRWP